MEGNHEKITADCHQTICASLDTPFYQYQPSGQMRCYNMNDRQVTRLNVPSSFETNLCKMLPVKDPETCPEGTHGMLLGLLGSRHKDLYQDAETIYRDSIVAEAGAGLFLNGGNPLYYTAKGTREEIANRVLHAVLRSHEDDLAGHHIVFKLEEDSFTGEPQMRIDKLPLVSQSATLDDSQADRDDIDPAENLFQASKLSFLPSSGNQGWLQNLEGTMRSEQTKVDTLYPLSSSSSSDEQQGGDWSCPLLRVAFWSQVTEGFSPLVPSPVRAARLFGTSQYNMLYGTRSHPTQEFRSLFSRLGNVHTSNGFCYCLNPAQCQVLHSSTENKECTLLETIRSLYDQKLRTAKVLTTPEDACKDQLDWPFEPGFMRDKSINFGRNDASQQCNVLDRLPLFQYRYRPIGAVRKPEDGRTTLDEGGSCHMGRATVLNKGDIPSVVSTQVCRRIHSNYTHIVVRCTGDQNTYTDYELGKEKSKAPDWMVANLKQSRQKCDSCSKVPKWKTESGDFDLPQGPEVSYGIPFRWSASRLLAADFRSMVCGGTRHNQSTECDNLLNVREGLWKGREAFAEGFFGSNMSKKLLSSNLGTSGDVMSIKDSMLNFSRMLDASLDENLFLWGGSEAPGWVACSQTNSTCHGKMSKKQWYDRATRADTCRSVFAQQVQLGLVNSTAQGLDICNLNTQTNRLCQVLKSAQVKVFEANCIFAGICAPQIFVYTPGKTPPSPFFSVVMAFTI